MGGAFALQVIMTVLFMPESAYHRVGAINIDTGEKAAIITDKLDESSTVEHHETHGDRANSTSSQGQQRQQEEQPKSFLRELLPYSGYYDRVSFWRTLLRPFIMLASPMVVWATLLFTVLISWLVLISVTLSQIFSAPPYNFSVSAVGASNLSSFVASTIGTIVAGPLVDGVVRLMSKMNKGVFGMCKTELRQRRKREREKGVLTSSIEPEFRLPIMSTALLFTVTGFFAWGESLATSKPWPVPVIVCLGLINLGVQLATTGVVTYVADCHRQQAAEAFAVMNFLKNAFAFGLTFYVNDWITNQGVRNCFFVIGGISTAATLTTVPMYIYGKRARSFTARTGLIARFS